MPTRYRRRVVDNQLDVLVAGLPAVAIEGVKGAGKTRTATERAATAFALDDPGQLAVARGDPPAILRARPPVLIDEWQRLPETWDLSAERSTTAPPHHRSF